MHATSVTPTLVDPQRLDPDYYHPQHLEDEQRLRDHGSVPLKDTGKFFAGPFGSKLPSSLYLDSGVPLFRVGNVGSMEVDLRDMAHLAPHVHAELASSEVRAGDLLIVKASVGEKICRVPASMDKANITQHIIAIRPNGKYDLDYLAAFLFGQYGRRQLERRSLGSIIQYLGIADSKTVLFPKLEDKAQVYIGDKVRQAERLRTGARFGVRVLGALVEAISESRLSEDELLALITSGSDAQRDDLAQLARVILPHPTAGASDDRRCRHSRVAHLDIIDRINAEAYSAELLQNARMFAACSLPRKRLGEVVTSPINNSIRDITTEYRQGGGTVPMFRPADIDGIWLNPDSAPRLRASFEEGHKKARVFPGDIVMAAAGTIAKVGRVPFSVEYGNINGSCARIAPPSGSEGYLLMYLASRMARLSLMRLAVGSVQKHLNLEDIPNIGVIWPAEKVRGFIGEHVQHAEYQHEYAKRLTTAAKLLVEGLINGHVSEADLQAAHADRDADRAVLRRLTAKGVDVPGEPPLFPDLAQLEQVLADATAN